MVQTRVIAFSLLGLAHALQFDAKSKSGLSNSQDKSQAGYASIGILHYVATCQQCGHDWCAKFPLPDWGANNNQYAVGNALSAWGCENVPQNPISVKGPGGKVYALETQKIHHLTSCTQCPGYPNFCTGSYAEEEYNIEEYYTVSSPVSEWGCDSSPNPANTVRNAGSGAIYIVQPATPGVLHHVTQCSQCGKEWCNDNDWGINAPGVEDSYVVGDALDDWGCDNIPESPMGVRNSQTGAIYVLGPNPKVYKTAEINGYCVDSQGRTFDAYKKNDQTLFQCQALCTSIPQCVSLTFIPSKNRCVIQTGNQAPSQAPEGGWSSVNSGHAGEGKAFYPDAAGNQADAQCYLA